LLITNEEDREYLEMFPELEWEVVLAVHFKQFKRAEEMRMLKCRRTVPRKQYQMWNKSMILWEILVL
jgi:hypothetical protein